jgi:hypothetical protein
METKKYKENNLKKIILPLMVLALSFSMLACQTEFYFNKLLQMGVIEVAGQG